MNDIKTHSERVQSCAAWSYCGDAADIDLYAAEIRELRAALAARATPAQPIPNDGRKTLDQIAGWLDASVSIKQNGPDDYGPATEFDYQLGQAASEIWAVLRADQQQPVPCFDEKWSKGDDIVCTDSLPIAGINVQSKHGHIHGNAIEFFAEKLEVAQARRDKVLSLLSEAAALAEVK